MEIAKHIIQSYRIVRDSGQGEEVCLVASNQVINQTLVLEKISCTLCVMGIGLPSLWLKPRAYYGVMARTNGLYGIFQVWCTYYNVGARTTAGRAARDDPNTSPFVKSPGDITSRQFKIPPARTGESSAASVVSAPVHLHLFYSD